MNKIVCWIFLVLATLMLAACGGGGSASSSSPPPPSPVNVQGLWSGTYSIQGGTQNVELIGMIMQGGDAVFYDPNGISYILPPFSGGATVSGTMAAFPESGTTLPNGQIQESFTVNGSVSTASIAGTFSNASESGTVSVTPFTPTFTGTPTIVAGQWQGSYEGGMQTAVDITVQANGSFSGSDAFGCQLSGTVTQVGTANLFTVSANSVALAGSGSQCLGSVHGLAYESSVDEFGTAGSAKGTYYYADVFNAMGAVVVEFYMP